MDTEDAVQLKAWHGRLSGVEFAHWRNRRIIRMFQCTLEAI